MITLQHTLVTLVGLDGDEKQLKKEVPYVLLPDAIRRYLGPRQYSHFEESYDGSDISWIKYPEDLKSLSKESAETIEKYIVPEIKPCVFGERTQIGSFVEHNADLSPLYYAGVLKHLVQDYIFDDFIRKIIDCSKMYEDKFVFQGQEYDGKGIRKVIADIENHGLYLLASLVQEYYGITANQEWFDKTVKSQLDSSYSQDLSDGTYNYMKIPAQINEWITNKDWSHINEGLVAPDVYATMYNEVINSMVAIDEQRKMKEEIMGSGSNGPKGDGSAPNGPTGN